MITKSDALNYVRQARGHQVRAKSASGDLADLTNKYAEHHKLSKAVAPLMVKLDRLADDNPVKLREILDNFDVMRDHLNLDGRAAADMFKDGDEGNTRSTASVPRRRVGKDAAAEQVSDHEEEAEAEEERAAAGGFRSISEETDKIAASADEGNVRRLN